MTEQSKVAVRIPITITKRPLGNWCVSSEHSPHIGYGLTRDSAVDDFRKWHEAEWGTPCEVTQGTKE